jgi:cytochrome c553
MPERYVAQQLALFKSGQRNTGMAAIMMPMAMPLSAQDMRDLGAYFSQQKAGAGIGDDSKIATGLYAGKKYYEVGQMLFRGGDPARGVPACMSCHGPTGAGNPGPPYPHLAGQQSAYAVRRLQEYRAGKTSETDTHQFNIMATVAKSLTDEEIQSLASYLQGLHPRADEAAVATSAPSAAYGPAAPTATPAMTPAASAPPAKR